MEKPAEAGGAPLGGRLKLCEGDTRIRWAIIIIDSILGWTRIHVRACVNVMIKNFDEKDKIEERTTKCSTNRCE